MCLFVLNKPRVSCQQAKGMRVILLLGVINKLNSYVLLFLSLAYQAIRNVAFLLNRFSDILASEAFRPDWLAKFMHPHTTLGACLNWIHYLIAVAKACSAASFE